MPDPPLKPTINIIRFLNGPTHELDLNDIYEFVADAVCRSLNNRRVYVNMIVDPRLAPYGAAVVVWEGSSYASHEEIADALVAHGHPTL